MGKYNKHKGLSPCAHIKSALYRFFTVPSRTRDNFRSYVVHCCKGENVFVHDMLSVLVKISTNKQGVWRECHVFVRPITTVYHSLASRL